MNELIFIWICTLPSPENENFKIINLNNKAKVLFEIIYISNNFNFYFKYIFIYKLLI